MVHLWADFRKGGVRLMEQLLLDLLVQILAAVIAAIVIRLLDL